MFFLISVDSSLYLQTTFMNQGIYHAEPDKVAEYNMLSSIPVSFSPLKTPE